MGFGGGSASTPPAAQPVTPIPQQDDPRLLETKRRAAVTAKGREGDSAHLLAKDEDPRRIDRANSAATVY